MSDNNQSGGAGEGHVFRSPMLTIFPDAERIRRSDFNLNHLEPGYVILGLTDNFVYVRLEVRESPLSA